MGGWGAALSEKSLKAAPQPLIYGRNVIVFLILPYPVSRHCDTSTTKYTSFQYKW